MRKLIRRPLTWLILAECVVVGALVLVAWSMVAAISPRDATAPLGLSSSAGSTDSPLPSLGLHLHTSTVVRQRAGLNVDPGFWRRRLDELNRGEGAFEVLEWKIVHSAMDTIRRYLQSVVLPSVVGAERRGG